MTENLERKRTAYRRPGSGRPTVYNHPILVGRADSARRQEVVRYRQAFGEIVLRYPSSVSAYAEPAGEAIYRRKSAAVYSCYFPGMMLY